MDTEVRDRIKAAVIAAIVEASYNATLGCPVVRTGEVVDALLTALASACGAEAPSWQR